MTTNDRHPALPTAGGSSPWHPGGDLFAAPGSEPWPSEPVLPELHLPPPEQWALFLDLDGTLLDLAATPDAVRPEDGLEGVLTALEARTSGALAIVTGRPVPFVDGLFPGHRFTAAGLHGAEFRPGPALSVAPPMTGPQSDPVFAALRDLVRQQAARLPGVIFEDKGRAFALHTRLAPEHAAEVATIMQSAADRAGPGWQLRPGKCVIELCPAGHDKGQILRNLMSLPPFLGRYPVAVGDDLTDEAMFGAANALGGLSLRIGPAGELAKSAAVAGLPSPAAFRTWIRRLVA